MPKSLTVPPLRPACCRAYDILHLGQTNFWVTFSCIPVQIRFPSLSTSFSPHEAQHFFSSRFPFLLFYPFTFLPFNHIHDKLPPLLRPDQTRHQLTASVAPMNVTIAVGREFAMQIFLSKLPLAPRPADDLLVGQKRVQVAAVHSENLANLSRRIAEPTFTVQFFQFSSSSSCQRITSFARASSLNFVAIYKHSVFESR